MNNIKNIEQLRQYIGRSITLTKYNGDFFPDNVTIGKKYFIIDVIEHCSNQMFAILDDNNIRVLVEVDNFAASKKDWIKFILLNLHSQEDKYNSEICKIDGQILDLQCQKKKFAAQISKNMKHRNKLINML